MDKMKAKRLLACAVAALYVSSLTACESAKLSVSDTSSAESAQTDVQSDTDTESDTASGFVNDDDTDIGEHKDYDKENAECFESGEIIIVTQDGKKRGMETYTMTLGSGCLEFYATELNTHKELAGNKVNMYSMIVPTACELYCPASERYRIDSQEQIISDVKDMLVGVTQIDVLPTLRNHNAENIYFRTDSRWTPLGAYYAGKVFAKQAGVPYADISEYRPTSPIDFVGDLASLAYSDGYDALHGDPDKFSFYAPSAVYTTNYYDENFTYLTTNSFYSEIPESPADGYYSGGFYSLRIDTPVKNDRRLLIVKDEFGTFMPTFFTSSFEEVYVVSYNYLEANLLEMISEFGITDVLYLMNTYTVTDTRVYTLETLRTQATHGTLKDDAPDSESDSSSDSDSDSDKKDPLAIDSDTDTVEYIYDVGVNNQVGIVENSEPAAPEYSPEDDVGGNDYDDGNEGSDYGEETYEYDYDDDYGD